MRGEAEVSRVALVQHRCIHREQLTAGGLGRHAIARRLETRQMVALHPTVYLWGPGPPEPLSWAMAAVLRLRGDAVLSHALAGFVWGFLDEKPALVDVTLVGRCARPRPGTRVHRTPTLLPQDVRWRRGLPLTAPARTLVDLAGTLDVVELESALAGCLHSRLATKPEILAASQRKSRHAGVSQLRSLLKQDGLNRTRLHYERLLLRLIREAGLPSPQTNHDVIGHNVDMVWVEQRLVVEFDGFKFHGDRRAFETDRRRDQDLAAAGYRVIRVTARQLEAEPYAVIARLAAALAVRA